jgi:hypothetical protein
MNTRWRWREGLAKNDWRDRTLHMGSNTYQLMFTKLIGMWLLIKLMGIWVCSEGSYGRRDSRKNYGGEL